MSSTTLRTSEGIAVVTRREWYHKTMAVFGIGLFVTYTLMLFGQLN